MKLMDDDEVVSLGDVASDWIGFVGADRLPVANREPRPEPNPKLWGAIMSRDGSCCWICGTTLGMLVLEHIHPRSAWEPEQMHLADRSDNLRIACWNCNEQKSNRPYVHSKPVPVVFGCPDDYEDEEAEDYSDYPSVAAYCTRHGLTVRVPEWWPIAGLT